MYLDEQLFYSKTERGINETQVRVLALLLVRYIDAGPILKWAYNVLDLKSCIDDAVARESLNVLHKPCKDIGARSKEFETFVRGTTIGEREAAARTLCLFDGVGRTDIKIDEQHIKDYLTFLFTTKSPLPGACHDGRNTQKRKTTALRLVASVYVNEREKWKTLYARGAEEAVNASEGAARAAGLPPGRVVRVSQAVLQSQLVESEAARAPAEDARKKLEESKRVQKNRAAANRVAARAELERRTDKVVAKKKDAIDSESDTLRSQLNAAIKKAAEDAKWKKTREPKSDPQRVRYLEGKLAGVNLDNMDLRVENAKLKDELRAANAKLAGQPKIWVPTRGSGRGAGSGQAHDWRYRVICFMCHVLLVPPRAINEVFVICAHAILGKDYVTTLGMELPPVDWVRSTRIELGALNRLVAADVIARAPCVLGQQFDSTPYNGDEFTIAPIDLPGKRVYGEIYQIHSQTSEAEAQAAADHLTRMRFCIEALRLRVVKSMTCAIRTAHHNHARHNHALVY